MPVVRRGTHDRVHVVARQQLAVVDVRSAAAIAVRLVHTLLARLTTIWVHVTDGDDLDFGHPQKMRQVRAVHHVPDANRRHGDSFIGRHAALVAHHVA